MCILIVLFSLRLSLSPSILLPAERVFKVGVNFNELIISFFEMCKVIYNSLHSHWYSLSVKINTKREIENANTVTHFCSYTIILHTSTRTNTAPFSFNEVLPAFSAFNIHMTFCDKSSDSHQHRRHRSSFSLPKIEINEIIKDRWSVY